MRHELVVGLMVRAHTHENDDSDSVARTFRPTHTKNQRTDRFNFSRSHH